VTYDSHKLRGRRADSPVILNNKKALLFLISAAAALAVSYVPLSDLVRNGRPSDYYTHIPLVPMISAFVIFRRRKKLFRGEPGSPLLGLAVIALGCGLLLFDRFRQPGLIGHAELCAGAAILFMSGSFLALFGPRSFQRALFPFLFLVFGIPLPLAWMGHLVSALVTASTGLTNLLFRAFGVPFIQEGSVFYLPDFDIEVAHECSGIRSSLALLITSVLAGQIFLARRWKKIMLVLAILPVTILKNAIRIVTLYLLSYFVDVRIIQGGFLHKSGGFIFFGLGLVILAYVLWLLRSPREAWEKAIVGRRPPPKKGLTNG
jgi:exosortase